MEKVVLNVEGMSCAHCERAVVSGLNELAGVERVAVDLAAKTVAVEFDSAVVSLARIEEEIEEELMYDVVR